MSRAFVKEAEDDEPVKLPDRPISPHPNLVTPEGLASIERTIDRFTAAYKAALGKHDKAAIAAAQARASVLVHATGNGKACPAINRSHWRSFWNDGRRAT